MKRPRTVPIAQDHAVLVSCEVVGDVHDGVEEVLVHLYPPLCLRDELAEIIST
ncbi:hypothetical protein PNP85_10050 [Halobacterium salinarum]|uniref:hypothetical protein n=1 Tax=Halobacterium salinarum TaxID=2242 RepID=UPI0025529DC7|nr:hypothetical protein [Halobacterium salinarum]MDL0128167.1 hypothetical protein [Halobacterium salinarum]MDL0139844.1 hypothetical protein [Halobacterium salinarum]